MAKQKKTNNNPKGIVRNNPGGSGRTHPKGQVPKMRTPPPPKKKD